MHFCNGCVYYNHITCVNIVYHCSAESVRILIFVQNIWTHYALYLFGDMIYTLNHMIISN